ncbi:hypothetical protein HYPSUDRAFT_149958 [Hypholoma sublateritium FD-334 SS-4]|uniref:Exoribonuclease phosphorolytic domain-containing protein n=1 Tax=Hypholoma sublateritium (strain FD-334 SS-4) TaxID=945553 RepID=A0A0D2N6S1_HYPSF|nr:hypothetical protein HYPSUDRAFT_149958 [Hypholoma sublateritium FD-334 SS-4]
MSTPTRRDGRTSTKIRQLRISYDGLARVDGSARFAFGDDTSALAAVSGPIEVRLAAEIPSKATFEVLVRPLANIPATEAKLVAANIKSTIEPSLILTKSPRTMVQLVIQSLTSPVAPLWKDSLTASMINASTLAFLQAGSVLMQGVVAAVAVGRLSNGTLVVDPSEEEAETLLGGGSFAFLFSDQNAERGSRVDCVWSNWKVTDGGYLPNEFFQARELAKAGATQVYNSIRKSVETMSGAAQSKRILQAGDTDESSSDDEKMEIERYVPFSFALETSI